MMRHFPRFSLGGSFVLMTYLYATKFFFDESYYGHSLRSGEFATSSYIVLNGIVMAMSLLSVIGHTANVLGELRGASVLSIIVGVGFDVTTRILQLIWWVQLSAIAFLVGTENYPDSFKPTTHFLVLQSIMPYIFHMPIHIQALRMKYHSYLHVIDILCAALNNLRGIDGGGFKHHFLAFSNLGGHVVPLYLSAHILYQQRSLSYWFCSLILLVAALTVVIYRIPALRRHEGEKTPLSVRRGKIDCRCQACKMRFEDTLEYSSFIFMREGRACHLCVLWLEPFEELSDTLLRLAFCAE